MLKEINEIYTEGTHIVFREISLSDSGKTRRFEVRTKDGILLGRIAWMGRWRKYSFDPVTATTYEETCLQEIAEFLEVTTRKHREARKKTTLTKMRVA